ncbi:biopolymer transporter ExbD [Simkania negevensis]|uniref:Biopolymer transporter ExbD n=1 Tax=Simkania negevensis TaxID=83561 RepID=A0ABS3ARL8_9BACT|nr:biopolymer transporter ExbD [Simkania negevensis]
MSFVPEEEIGKKTGINLAPMIDFLFLMLAFFACLAVTREATKDTNLELVAEASQPTKAINYDEYKLITLNINRDGSYEWVTDLRDYPLEKSEDVYDELARQYQKGVLPKEKEKTKVILKIDKEAQWEPILKLVLAVKEIGFEVRPVYQKPS